MSNGRLYKCLTRGLKCTDKLGKLCIGNGKLQIGRLVMNCDNVYGV